MLQLGQIIGGVALINIEQLACDNQYSAWLGRQNGALPTWVYCSQTPPLQVTEQCDMGLTPLYVSKLFHLYWCNSLSVWSKLQHNILIFGLVMVET